MQQFLKSQERSKTVTTGKALDGKPYAGNPHVRFDEGEVASAATPRRGSLLYKMMKALKAAVVAGLILIGRLASAATIEVSTVAQLTNALDVAQRNHSTDTILLKKGFYDVSGCAMMRDNGSGVIVDSCSHISVCDKCVLKGETDNPRDTVIYGDKSNRIVYYYSSNGHRAVLQNLTISNGYAKATNPYPGGYGYGGGVLGRNLNGLVSNCVVTCCSADDGGGGAYKANFMDSIIENCSSAQVGGGLYASERGFINGVIRNCTAGTHGGGAQSSTLKDSLIIGNVAVGNGGGVNYNDYGGISNCVITGNSAYRGGGINWARGGRCGYNIISNNVAVQGGGIFQSHAYNCTIVHNLARGREGMNDTVYGGGCGGNSDASSEVYDSEVSGNACARENSTSDRSGGAGEYTKFYRCRIFNNFSHVGAALNFGLAEDCVISNNVAGSFVYGVRCTTSLKRCKLYNVPMCSPGILVDCVITGLTNHFELAEGENCYTNGAWNTTAMQYLFNNNASRHFALTNCLFTLNRGYYLIMGDKANEDVNVVNCTFADNVIGAVWSKFKTGANGCRLNLKNCISVGNVRYDDPSISCNMRTDALDDTNVCIENCLFGPGVRPEGQSYVSTNNIIYSSKAGFCGAEKDPAHPYSLRWGSPARNAGTVEDWMTTANDIRGAGYPRLREGKVDLGCYQCWLDPLGLAISFR